MGERVGQDGSVRGSQPLLFQRLTPDLLNGESHLELRVYQRLKMNLGYLRFHFNLTPTPLHHWVC